MTRAASARRQGGWTPLHRAVQSNGPNAPEVVRLLIAAKADICAKDSTNGKPPAAYLPDQARSATPQQLQMGRLLIEEGRRRGVDPGYAQPTAASTYVTGACSGGGGGGGCGGGGCGGGGCGGGGCGG